MLLHPTALPDEVAGALHVLRAELGAPPQASFPRDRASCGRLIAWLTASGLGPAYRKGLRHFPHPPLPADVHDALDALHHGALARNMVLFSELGRIQEAAEKRGIALIPLKGVPAIACLHGGDIAMRPMADLDLLVRPSRMDEALALLDGLGYAPARSPICSFLQEKARHALPRVHPRRKAMVEIHRGADYAFRDMGQAAMPDFFAGARRVAVDGREMLLPSWPAWMFQWAVHTVYMDVYSNKMRDLYDMARLLAFHGDEVPWSEVVDPCRTLYLLRPLAMGLALVEDLFGVAPPSPWKERLRALAFPPAPVRDLPVWLIRNNLVDAVLTRRIPLSVLSALCLASHLPGWTPRLVREFLRIFVFPPPTLIEKQYGLRRGIVGTPWMYLLRAGHVLAVIADRLARKLLSLVAAGGSGRR